MADRFDKAGVLHVHTRYSDGNGTVEAVARAAARAGVDFVAITDHDSLAGLDNGEEGWYDAHGRKVERRDGKPRQGGDRPVAQRQAALRLGGDRPVAQLQDAQRQAARGQATQRQAARRQAARGQATRGQAARGQVERGQVERGQVERRPDAAGNASTLVIFGQEISPDDGNHFVAFGLNETVSKNQSPEKYVREVARRGGFGFIAHPIYPEPERYPLRTFPWTDWDVAGYTGMEIWTYTVDWLVDVTTVPRLVAALSFPDAFVSGPFPEALARWDELCRHAWRRGRKVVGIGSTDAHGILYSYRRMFKTVRTHVLLEDDWSGDADRDKAAVQAALRAGHAYVAYDALQDAAGFRFTAEGSGAPVHMGGTVSMNGTPMTRETVARETAITRRTVRSSVGSATKLRLRAAAPARCILTLRTPDGIVAQVESDKLEHRVTQAGVYRVEAHLRDKRGPRPWVFTNPIYIR